MIKFFRKIRQNLLKQNKIGKYLVYAFGEIILVVIGIIIALQLNNKNQEKENQAKVINIFKEIQKDLKTDIQKVTFYHNNYVQYDSIQKLIFNNKYTFEDYQNNSTILIGSYYKEFIPLRNGFSQLRNNFNIVPKKYDSIVAKLKALYEVDLTTINTYNERFKNTVYKNLDFLYSTDWSLEYKRNIRSKELINYFLNDKRYKNYLIKYFNDYQNLVIEAQHLRYSGIKIFNDIQKITNSTIAIPNYMNYNQTNTTIRNAIIGNYNLISKTGNGWANNLEIIQKNKSLLWKVDNEEDLLIHNYKNIYTDFSATYYKFKKDTLYIEAGISGRSTYIKTKN